MSLFNFFKGVLHKEDVPKIPVETSIILCRERKGGGVRSDISDPSIKYLESINNGIISWTNDKATALKFSTLEEAKKGLENDEATKNLIRSQNFFILMNGDRIDIIPIISGLNLNDMSKHSFKSNPITKEDPGYTELKDILVNKIRSEKIKESYGTIGLVLPTEEDLDSEKSKLPFQKYGD